MIASSRTAKLAALSFAGLAHAAIALALAAPDETMTEGSGGAAEVRLGNAFADMAAGALSAQTARDTMAHAAPEVAPVTAERPDVLPAPQVPGISPLKAAPAPGLAPTRPREVVSGETPDTATLARSPRPAQRSAAFEQRHRTARPEPTSQARKSQAQPAPRQAKSAPAGARQETRAGTNAGTATARARSSGSGGAAQSAGTAAASTYPGLVMRRIARAGRPEGRARGAAVVAFSISPGGALSAISIARSSGTAAFDRAALAVVRNAAPFPRPPAGARRSFSIRIQGR
ncbi:TonB family protein [Marinovum sp. SP66]|uniref:energy transducer TonB family protein n=1 Tax=Marinovum TaxID=367771 RepID=UPI00237A95B6|nr:TonB family protein [Marinovum sp. SP66]MDD9741619.1 TonB family protein [Marinovum sp. SP66]